MVYNSHQTVLVTVSTIFVSINGGIISEFEIAVEYKKMNINLTQMYLRPIHKMLYNNLPCSNIASTAASSAASASASNAWLSN